MVADVAYYAKEKEITRELLFWSLVRAKTLQECYRIPGYAELPTAEKNRIYDEKRNEIERRERK